MAFLVCLDETSKQSTTETRPSLLAIDELYPAPHIPPTAKPYNPDNRYNRYAHKYPKRYMLTSLVVLGLYRDR